jgi:hypothetical protein
MAGFVVVHAAEELPRTFSLQRATSSSSLRLKLCFRYSRPWRRGGKPDRTHLTDPQAVALMKSIHAEVKAAYGSRRMHR